MDSDSEVVVGGSDCCVAEPREANRRWMSKAVFSAGAVRVV